ncbi:hypothetical protein [Candidatus Symbiopectobacterium sp. NZEC135]|uniref:hypothetical protein n=1 Tax=Candidatus Symbiopectobacterium sp. NZEC135 TaxID=2820471 RepID=UPI0022270272|nr:hypothetical protein [Candidatus Symbiopectobacterium sp. NZEC135]MCW2479899.1 hypothetical protein [Candidatus Symbiopectobacterium sp. NZEC135]
MNGITPLSVALQNLNAGIVQSRPTSDSGEITLLSTNVTPSSTKVTLSDDSRYQALLSQIGSNTVSSVNNNNTKSVKEILGLIFQTGAQVDRDYRFLDDKPETEDTSRLAMAQQAADYIKTMLYSDGQTQNPFEGLSRQVLSSITYDRSGSWTTAERLSAFWQMNKLDTEYGNEVFFKTQGIDDYDTVAVNLMTDLKMIQGMSEAEKSEKMITKDSIKDMQGKVAKLQDENKDKLLQYTPLEYNNLMKGDSTDLLIAKETGFGSYMWVTESSKSIFTSMVEKNEKINTSSMVLLAR